MFKVNYKNITMTCSSVFIVNFEHTSHLFIVFLSFKNQGLYEWLHMERTFYRTLLRAEFPSSIFAKSFWFCRARGGKYVDH